MSTIPLDQALALYPASVLAHFRAAGIQIASTTQLWILGYEIEWRDYKLGEFDSQRLPHDDAVALIKANTALAAGDDLPGLLDEFRARIGIPVEVGDVLAWDSSPGWERTYPGMPPQGRLIERDHERPEMAYPLCILVKPMHAFPAWTLTRKSGVRKVSA